MKTPLQMVVIHRLGEITNDSILQGAIPDDLIRVCGNQDRRNGASRIDKFSVELNSGHSGHLDVGDQAGSFREERRCEEIGCRRERFYGVAQRRYEVSHGFAKGLIVLDDRYQYTFWHRGFRQPLGPQHIGTELSRAACNWRNVSEGSRQCNGGAPKRWLMLSAFRSGRRLFVSRRGE